MKTVATARPWLWVTMEDGDPAGCMTFLSVFLWSLFGICFAVWGVWELDLQVVFFFFFNRADRKDVWSLHQIFITSKEKFIKVFSVKKDDQRGSVLYHLLSAACEWREGLEWLSSHNQISHPTFNLDCYWSLVTYIKAFGFVMKLLIRNVHSKTAYIEYLRE